MFSHGANVNTLILNFEQVLETLYKENPSLMKPRPRTDDVRMLVIPHERAVVSKLAMIVDRLIRNKNNQNQNFLDVDVEYGLDGANAKEIEAFNDGTTRQAVDMLVHERCSNYRNTVCLEAKRKSVYQNVKKLSHYDKNDTKRIFQLVKKDPYEYKLGIVINFSRTDLRCSVLYIWKEVVGVKGKTRNYDEGVRASNNPDVFFDEDEIRQRID